MAEAQTVFQYYHLKQFMIQGNLEFKYDDNHPAILESMKKQHSFMNACLVMFEAEGMVVYTLFYSENYYILLAKLNF
jgi:hypothetical protein